MKTHNSDCYYCTYHMNEDDKKERERIHKLSYQEAIDNLCDGHQVGFSHNREEEFLKAKLRNLDDRIQEIKHIHKDTDLKTLQKNKKMAKVNGWDVHVDDEQWDVWHIKGYNWCIGSRWDDYWCCPAGEEPTYKNLRGFQGHVCCWGIRCEEYNYLKSKWSSGDSLERSCKTVITKNGKPFYTVCGRTMEYALIKAKHVLDIIQEHSVGFWEKDWKKDLIGREIYYRNEPAIIQEVWSDCNVYVVPDMDGKPFSKPAWARDEPDYWDEYKYGLKVDIIESNDIWWWRKD